MERLCDWDATEFTPFGSVHHWAEALRGKRALIPEKTLRTARLATGGAVVAWAEVMKIDDEAERADERKKLKANPHATLDDFKPDPDGWAQEDQQEEQRKREKK